MARLGGDEFAILQTALAESGQAAILAEHGRLLAAHGLCKRSTGTKSNLGRLVAGLRAYVTTGAFPDLTDVRIAGRVRGAAARSSRTHSGQCTPTAAWVWHCGQIVRPHRWHSTKLGRSG